MTGPEEAYKKIDYNTLAFLFGMMALKCLLARHKYFLSTSPSMMMMKTMKHEWTR